MGDFSKQSRIVITCQRGLARWLADELVELGHSEVEQFHGGVSTNGSLLDCQRLNMTLRCASQALYSLRRFRCNSPEFLYRELGRINWEEWLGPESYFSVTSNVEHPSIRSSMYANVRVKDAIVDRIRGISGERPNSGHELNGIVVHLFWRGSDAELFLDTSGPTIAKHGYRRLPGKAPLSEALAAALIRGTNWRGETPFVNPMCGSGTLAIEAALIATGRAPGLFREDYAFKHLRGFEPETFEQIRSELQQKVHPPAAGVEIVASDHDPEAVATAKANATAAGVSDLIAFELCDFRQTRVPEAPGGVVIFNPEYGHRLGEVRALETTYKELGDFLKQRCRGYRGYVFTANPELAKKVGLRTSRRMEFATAKLEARLLEYELYEGTRKNKEPKEQSLAAEEEPVSE
ncbi:MAG: class I SAM-dependent RNA methyltransferase [Planctomycetota bacterium]